MSGQVAIKSTGEIVANECLLVSSGYLFSFEATSDTVNLKKSETGF